jgi:hypothetical protein
MEAPYRNHRHQKGEPEQPRAGLVPLYSSSSLNLLIFKIRTNFLCDFDANQITSGAPNSHLKPAMCRFSLKLSTKLTIKKMGLHPWQYHSAIGGRLLGPSTMASASGSRSTLARKLLPRSSMGNGLPQSFSGVEGRGPASRCCRRHFADITLCNAASAPPAS